MWVSFNLQCISLNFFDLPFSVVETEVTQPHTCCYHKNYQQLSVDNFKGTHTHNQTCSYSLVLDRKYFIFNSWDIWSNRSLKKLLSWFIQIYGWKDKLKLVKEIIFCLPRVSRIRAFSGFHVTCPIPADSDSVVNTTIFHQSYETQFQELLERDEGKRALDYGGGNGDIADYEEANTGKRYSRRSRKNDHVGYKWIPSDYLKHHTRCKLQFTRTVLVFTIAVIFLHPRYQPGFMTYLPFSFSP